MPELSCSWQTEHGGHRIVVFVGDRSVETPPVEHLMFYAGLGALAATHVIPPPVAVTIGVGHFLLDVTHRPGFQALGTALEEA